MTARAYAEFDLMHGGPRVSLVREIGSRRDVFQWGNVSLKMIDETNAGTEIEDSWLNLSDDEARAVYVALGDYFGHGGHDTRALRRDYDAERARVDRMLAFLVGGS